MDYARCTKLAVDGLDHFKAEELRLYWETETAFSEDICQAKAVSSWLREEELSLEDKYIAARSRLIVAALWMSRYALPRLRGFVPGFNYAVDLRTLIAFWVSMAQLSMTLKRLSEACDILKQARVALRRGHKTMDGDQLENWNLPKALVYP